MYRILALAFCFSIAITAAYSTTCAFDGHMIAADEQHTKGSSKHMGAKKIHYYPERKCYVSCAGDCAKIEQFYAWFDKQDKDVKVIGEYEAMACYEDGRLFVYQGNNQESIPMTPPFCLGSGQDFAMGAIFAGKNAREAVAIAEQLDIHTGGKITSFVVVPDNSQ